MITQILCTLSILILLYLFRICYLIPKKTMKAYIEHLQSRGYRVRGKPYGLFHQHFNQVIDKNNKSGDPFKVFREVYPHYDVVVTNLLNKPMIEFCHPDFIKDFYAVDKHYSYPKARVALDFITRITGNGLPFSEGKVWKHKRTLLNSVFNFQFLKSQTESISKICDKSLQKFNNTSLLPAEQGSKQRIVQFYVLDLFVQIFSRIMLTSFLGLTSEETIEGVSVAEFLKKLVDDATDVGFQMVSLMLGTRFLELGVREMDWSINRRIVLYKNWAITFIKNRIQQVNASLKQNPDKKTPSDIIEAIIIEKRKLESAESTVSQTDIYDEFTTFFFAGTDTTSNFTQMMVYYIAQNPQVEKTLREEVEKFMPQENYSYENLKNFKYIDNIQKQTTRIYGPGIFLFIRQACQDNHINGLPIKKGTMVSVIHQGNHFSEQYFKKPFQFRPERWDSECNDIPAFVTGGFSAGSRTCIGKHLAMLESKIALIKFMKMYKEIRLPKKQFLMDYKFLPCPEFFKTKLVLA